MDINSIANQNVFDLSLMQGNMPGLMQNGNPYSASNNPGMSFAERLLAAGNSGNSAEVRPIVKDSDIDKNSELFEMCRELETFLLKTLISSMRNTVQKSELLDIGFAGKFYEDMLYDEYAKSFAANAGLGFAEMAYRELSSKINS